MTLTITMRDTLIVTLAALLVWCGWELMETKREVSLLMLGTCKPLVLNGHTLRGLSCYGTVLEGRV